MATHVTHGDKVSSHPGGGHGTGQGHPPPFAQLPPIDAVVAEAASAVAVFTAITIAGVVESASASDALDAVKVVSANVIEAASALDAFDADVVAGGAVIPATVAEAASASDLANAVSDVAAAAIESASASDALDAAAVFAAAMDEPAGAVDAIDAAVGANIVSASVAEAADAVDQLDAAVVGEVVSVPGGGGGFVEPLRRPLPVVGYGYGILPQLEGEAHGVVGAVGKSAAQLVVRATAVGACGQAGAAAVTLKSLSVSGKGAIGARGSGAGTIMKFSGSATGHHDDDEAAVIAFLLAA